MHIAIEGCSHGELDIIYRAIQRLEEIRQLKIDLLLCCGDFQSVRNENDLKCMAVPIKYMQMQDFHKYYSGEKKAPILTIFIGGNHEASNYLQELPYGGWVAPNIYYLGYAGVVRVGDLRIGGLSGIYKGPDYLKGHYEKTPYTSSSIRSVYHVRNLEVFRLKQLSGSIDIMMSHDWPRGIYNHGNVKSLLKCKQHFAAEIKSNTLGSRAAEDLITKLQPNYWFSGHLHVKFAAIMKHKENAVGKLGVTKFLALDKCLPRREFLQILEFPVSTTQPLKLEHDAEWLTILRLTNHLLSTSNRITYMPGPGSSERYAFTPSEEEIKETISRMGGDLTIPLSNFCTTAACFSDAKNLPDMSYVQLPKHILNPQTQNICSKLCVDDPIALLTNCSKLKSSKFENKIRQPLNKSEMDITNWSFNTTDASNLSFNPDEVDVNNDDNFELSYSGMSGEFLLEIALSPLSNKSKESNLVLGISPIKGLGKFTPKRLDLLSPMAISSRFESPRTEFSLSKPLHINETPLTIAIDKLSKPPPPDVLNPDPASEASTASYLSLSSSQSEDDGKTSNNRGCPQLKRKSSSSNYRNSLSEYEEKDVQTMIYKTNGSKKLKRRNISMYY